MSERVVSARGREMPKIGLGTWRLLGRECEEAVRDALDIGYRQLDTAALYDNEEEVGRGLAASGVAREEVWLTTKVPMDDAEPGRVRRSAERSLRRLDTEYVDLLLLHWPNASVPLAATLEALMALREQGRTLEIGVSNFPPALFGEALGLAPVLVDQVEHHPFLGQQALLELCHEHDAVLTAYSPLAQGQVASDPTLEEIGRTHGKSPAQVALRWLVDQPRVAAVPKAASHERRVENFEIWDFELAAEERARIDALPKDRRDFDPAWAPDWSA